MHIALCDDSRTELSRLTFLLEEYRLTRDGSLTYDIFTNATDLLETIPVHHFDLLLLDILMPGITLPGKFVRPTALFPLFFSPLPVNTQ